MLSQKNIVSKLSIEQITVFSLLYYYALYTNLLLIIQYTNILLIIHSYVFLRIELRFLDVTKIREREGPIIVLLQEIGGMLP